MDRSFIAAVTPPATPTHPAWWFVFVGPQIIVADGEAGHRLPRAENLADLGFTPGAYHYLGTLDGVDCYAAEVDAATPVAAPLRLTGLRQLYGQVEDRLFWIAGRAAQILEWDRTHRYCGRCSTPVEPLPGERVKRCPQCGLVSYPRLSPAVIVLIERGEEVLLARGQNSVTGFYSILAGFVESGESLEGAVHREIYEEVGITVTNLRYFGSQPWPFPHSLMIGFTATYAGGDLRLQESEIATAAWFTRGDLPPLSPPLSIARQMIDDFVARHPQPDPD